MKIISLFSGVGGFEKGFLDAGYEFESYWSENDKYASAVFRYNFPNSNELGDATKIKPQNLPDFDVLVAGFPCQSFSIAGKRQGFDDIRGTLFFEIIRICKEKKPGILLLENVDGIIIHDNYATIITIHSLLSDIGYKGGWVVYNSKNFELPQNRSRCFFIYYFGKEPPSKVFFIGENGKKINKKEIQQAEIASTINTKKNSGQFSIDSGTTLICNDKAGAFTAGGHSGGLHSDMDIIIHNMQPRSGNPKKGGTGHLFRNDETTYCLDGGCTNVLEFKKHQQDIVYSEQGIMGSLPAGTHGSTSHHTKTLLNNGEIRRLTPIECERLQGFPDNWTKYGINENGNKIEISDTQRYKQVGNAVSTNVIKAIANYFK